MNYNLQIYRLPHLVNIARRVVPHVNTYTMCKPEIVSAITRGASILVIKQAHDMLKAEYVSKYERR